jgi:uncharacterized protein YhbP (UPF0306 family)
VSGAGADERALREEIVAFLESQHVASLATVVDGAAHAANVMYALEGLSLLWTSDPASRHSAAIERDPRVTATVAPDYTDFRLIRGAQIAGRARRLADAAEAAHARDLLRRRFPFLRELDNAPPGLRTAIGKAAYYRLDPESVTLIDNTRRFGDKRTLRIA